MVAAPHERLVDLVPFEPDNDVHIAELTRQRKLCGWNLNAVEGWRDKVRSGDKGLQWIFRARTPEAEELFKGRPLPDVEERGNLDENIEDGREPPSPSFRPIGHVSLDWYDEIGEEELASRALGNVTISSFFILVSQQGFGLGNIVMDEVERLAGSPPFNAKMITLNTLDGDVAGDPEYWKRYTRYEFKPGSRNNEKWYARRGYEAFRRGVPRYEDVDREGKPMKFPAVYMRKSVAA